MALRHLLFSSSFGWVERTIPFLLQILDLEKKWSFGHLFFLGTNRSEKTSFFDVLFYNEECFINASLQGISGVFIYFSDETLL